MRYFYLSGDYFLKNHGGMLSLSVVIILFIVAWAEVDIRPEDAFAYFHTLEPKDGDALMIQQYMNKLLVVIQFHYKWGGASQSSYEKVSDAITQYKKNPDHENLRRVSQRVSDYEHHIKQSVQNFLLEQCADDDDDDVVVGRFHVKQFMNASPYLTKNEKDLLSTITDDKQFISYARGVYNIEFNMNRLLSSDQYVDMKEDLILRLLDRLLTVIEESPSNDAKQLLLKHIESLRENILDEESLKKVQFYWKLYHEK